VPLQAGLETRLYIDCSWFERPSRYDAVLLDACWRRKTNEASGPPHRRSGARV